MRKDLGNLGGLRVTYTIHRSLTPRSDELVVLHHGICHSAEHFDELIAALNQAGYHVAMIDQQIEAGGWLASNWVRLGSCVAGMKLALESIEQDTSYRVGGFVLHSMGALIGETVQRDDPEWARPTVLLAPIPLGGALPVSLRLFFRYPLAYLRAVLTLNIRSLASTPARTRKIFFDVDTPDTLVERTCQLLKHASFRVYLQLVLRGILGPFIPNNDQRKLLITSPTDFIFRPSQYQGTLARYTPMDHVQSDGGHDFFMQYANETAERIASFLAKDASTSAVPPPHVSFEQEQRPKTTSAKSEARADSV